MGDGGVQPPPGPHFGLGISLISLSLLEVPSMFSFSLFLQNRISPGILDKALLFQLILQTGISPGILDKACSLSAGFCKTAFYQAYLTKHVLFQLILQNGISPGILDKACSLSACFGKTAFHQAYLTKHVLFQRFRGRMLL